MKSLLNTSLWQRHFVVYFFLFLLFLLSFLVLLFFSSSLSSFHSADVSNNPVKAFSYFCCVKQIERYNLTNHNDSMVLSETSLPLSLDFTEYLIQPRYRHDYQLISARCFE